MNKFIKNILIILLSMLLLISILIFSVLWTYSSKIPDYKFLKNYKPPVSSKVYSGDGELVADFSKEKRVFVPFNSIPKNVINSFLSAEDKNFFSHPGVDAKGVLRAVINNIFNIISSKRLEGASTITQQVAKNFLLTNEVSLNRKIKEAILAFRIERALSKQRILELYLNQIYLGSGAYGVAAASLEYFDKSIKDLNYSEAALLAALPKAPSRYNPYRDTKLAKFRRNLVLKNLLDNKYIDSRLYEKLEKEEIKLSKSKKVYLEDAQYYIEDVRKRVIENFTYDKVYKQGLNINTPINLGLQKIATDTLRDGLISYDKRKGWRGALTNKSYNNDWSKNLEEFKLESSINWKIAIVKKLKKFSAEIETEDKLIGQIKYKDITWTKKEFNKLLKIGDIIYVKKIDEKNYSLKQLPKINGGIIVMDPYTGRVLALSGGFSFKESEFNRVTQALRQPGSAFKPFVYALALENNYTPTSLILDAPLVLDQGDDSTKNIVVEGNEGYKKAQTFMKMIMPSSVKRVKKYRGKIPLFIEENIEQKLNQIFDSEIKLKSGGYLVINPTEALVSIDINSGSSIKGKNVESTALDTNIEAAEEIARQIKIRDLSGLIIIDFIDMLSYGNRRLVERKLKEKCRSDRARIQIGRISSFGLLEMSRQRLRESAIKWKITLTDESFAQKLLKIVELKAIINKAKFVELRVCEKICDFLKENFINDLTYFEKKNKMTIDIVSDSSLIIPEYIINIQNKSKKTIELIEHYEKLRNLELQNKDEKLFDKKETKKFKKKTYRKKKYFKKTK